jgi:mannosylglycerate hydrolase
MPVGYIPDPFGYPAQLPQILRGFGLDTLIFMRGMSQTIKDEHGAIFDWQAPDGSIVTAVYQRLGYFAASALGHPDVFGRFDGHAPELDWAKKRINKAVRLKAPLQNARPMLLGNGFDHMPEQPELPDLLNRLNEALDGITLEQSTLPAFVEALKADDAERGTVMGDLLGNANHPILSSVYSTRMYLKQRNHRAQHALVQIAEPMCAWLAATGRGPDARPFLDHAWQLLLRNHPHDDICGCSVDGVHEDDEVRFRQVEEITEEVLAEQLEALVKEGFAPPAQTGKQSADVWVFNPHPHAQRMAVTTRIHIPHPDGEGGEPVPARRFAGCTANGRPIDVATLRTEANVVRNNFLETTWARRYDVTFEVDVPPLGYQLVHLYDDGPPRHRDHTDRSLVIDDEAYRVSAEGGRLRIREKATGLAFDDALRFEYQLDDGDTYSFGPVPAHGPWWGEWAGATWHPERPDTLRLHHELTVPASYDREGGPQGQTTLAITTDVRLSPHHAVALDVRYTNTAKDGRLRAVLPTGITTRTACADGHFRWVERTKPHLRTPESDPKRYKGYPGELDYPTHHQGDFVMVEGGGRRVWVANRGLPEYELLDPEGNAHIAVTLHRAVGWLSVEGGRIRRCQAGPTVPTPGAQCQRPVHAELAFGVGDLPRADVVRHARAFAHPTWARELPALPHVEATGNLPRTGSLLVVDNPNVLLSACKPTDDGAGLMLRLYNTSSDSQDARVRLGIPADAWCTTDLREQWDDAAAQPVEDGAIPLQWAPHQIQTLRIR